MLKLWVRPKILTKQIRSKPRPSDKITKLTTRKRGKKRKSLVSKVCLSEMPLYSGFMTGFARMEAFSIVRAGLM